MAPRRRFSDQQEAGIGRQYRAGASFSVLAARHRTCLNTIQNALRRQGVRSRPHGEAERRYRYDDGFFDRIDTEAKAYWLGFLAADGGVIGGCLSIELARLDRKHLVLFRSAMKGNCPVHDTMRQDGRRFSHLSFSSRRLLAALERHTIVPRKTLTVRWPDLSRPLLRHYLRGYVDGDGCWSPKKPIFVLVGNLPFLRACRSFARAELDLPLTRFRRALSSPGIAYLQWQGRHQVRRLAEFVYRRATVFLPRKHRIALTI